MSNTQPVLIINGQPVGQIGGEGGSGGHTIEDQDGIALTQQPNMKFADSFVTNDSVGEATVVENIKEHTTASDYENATEDGIHVIDDGDDAVIGAVSDDYVEVTADGKKTRSQLYNELFALIDISKVSYFSKLVASGWVKPVEFYSSTQIICATITTVDGTATYSQSDYLQASGSEGYWRNITNSGVTSGNRGSDIVSNGTKIQFYYGNKKAVVDLQTTANRCLLNSGQTVEGALTPLLGSLVGGSLNDLKETFIGFGYNVTGAPDGNYGFLFCIKSVVDGSVAVNQNWCKNDSTTWHTRIFRNGSWGNWS